MKYLIPLALLISGLFPLGAAANFRLDDDEALSVVQDDACFVVSGSKHDHNGALARLKREEVSGFYNFAGYRCKIFNSYKDLKSHLSTSRLPKNSAIFVIQVAHGGPSGSALLNLGQFEAKSIAKEIRDLSEVYKVAFLNQSCFAGTMILEKLRWDEQNQDSQSIDRSCLWADSLPGRVAYLDDNLPNSTVPYNFEEAYLGNAGGTLSSAAWSQARTSDYFEAISNFPIWDLKSDTTNEIMYPIAGTMMTTMNNVIQAGKSGTPRYKDIFESAQFALNIETTDSKLRTVLKLLQNTPINLESIRQAIFFPPASDNKCSIAVRKFLVSQWYIEFQSNPSPWINFERNLRAGFIHYSDVTSFCSDYGQTNTTALDWAQWLSYHSPLGEEMMAFARNKDQIENLFKEPLSSEATPYSKSDYINKYEIAASIIGREIFKEETRSVQVSSTSSMVSGYPSMGNRGTTGNIIPAFIIASSNLDSLENQLDQRRRNACRSIKLKARTK